MAPALKTTAPTALPFSYTYTPRIALAPAERLAYLSFFLSKDVRAPALPSYRTPPLSDDAETLSGTFLLALAPRALAALPRDATVSVEAFVHCTNSHGETAVNQAGCARFYLETLLRGETRRADMLVPCANNFDKGAIELRLALDPQHDDPIEFTLAEPSSYDYRGDAAVARAEASVHAQAKLSMQPFTALGARRGFESMRAIHAPYYRAYGLTMPGPAFCLVRSETLSPPAYYENALDIVLRRTYPRLTISQARSRLANEGAGGASWREVAVVLARVLCVFVNYCTYLTDKIVDGHRGTLAAWLARPHDILIESFDVTFRLTNTGDCEDFTLAIALEARDIRDLAFESAAMQRVQRCRREMEFEMMLMGVFGGALSDALQHGAQFGGHLAGRLTPRPLFARRVSRVSAVARAAGARDGKIGASIDTAASADAVFLGTEFGRAADWAATLPVLNLEGTGILDPYAERNVNGPLHAYLSEGAPEETFYRVKYAIQVPPENEHPFYKTCQSSFLPDRADDCYACLETFYVNQHEGRAVSCSVPYPESRDITNDEVAFWTGEDMTPDMRAWLPHLLKHVHPVAPHSLPAHRASEAQTNVLLERLVLNSTTPIGERWQNMDYFLRDSQVTPERVAALRKALHEKRGVRRIQYFAEPVTASLGGWMIRVWLDEGAVAAAQRGVRS